MVLGITLSRAPLITQLGGILGRVERVVADEAFFGVRIVLLVVISHYNGIDLPSVGQGFVTSRMRKSTHLRRQSSPPPNF
jgi:hypothetical protein